MRLIQKLFPFTLWLGLKFVLHSRKAKHIKVITLTTIIGLIIGVAALITVLAIMDGFIYTAKSRITNLLPHITLNLSSEYINNAEQQDNHITQEENINHKINYFSRIIKNRIGKYNITNIYPSFETKAFIVNNQQLIPVFINAMPKEVIEQKLKNLGVNINTDSNKNNIINNGIIVSSHILRQLDNKTNISLITADNFSDFYNTNIISSFDAQDQFMGNLALVDIEYAKSLFKNNLNLIENLNIDLVYSSNADYYANKLLTDLPLNIITWSQYPFSANYLNILTYTKQMMFLLLSFIIVIAMFNLVATLSTMLNEKQAEMAILKTMGSNNKFIMKLIVSYGFIITTIGLFLGVITGIILANNIGYLASIIEKLLDFQFVNPNMYMIDFLPSKISASDIINIIFIVYIIMFCSLIYPMIKACKLLPAKTLRYE